jgi:hypothetical protein
MKYIFSVARFFCLLSLVSCLLSFSGCIRVAGTAGYSHIKDDEVVTKSTGFDLDSARLVPKNKAES